MLFSSIPFLYYFLPLVLAVYFLTPARFRNAVLLLASLIFYAWGEPKYVLLMLASILSGYGFGLLQERYRGQKGAKLVCGLSVAVSLGFPCCASPCPLASASTPSRSSAIRWMYTGASQLRKI